MPHVEAHTPGSFSWFELATSDQAAAKSFYQGLLGWTSHDHPMGPGEAYTIFYKDGRDVAAGYTLREDQRKQGVPPHWLVYVTVDNVDEMAKKAKSLGGTVVAEPFDVMENGRMAVVIDPAGAAIALWQPNKHPGVKITTDPGSFTWAELLTKDAAASKAFYTKLFGWTTMGMPLPGGEEYTVVSLGEKPVGGIYQLPADQPTPSAWGIYFEVEDCDATIDAAKAKGAKVCMGPHEMPNVGRFATLQDPQGAMFSVIKSVTPQ
jgi:predicted enzyme related to lactoylglutathione lyase